jgi:glycosyltransferase EpsH
MPTVSVLIPCYNSERHLEQCLRSVLGQTCPDLEVVCVDDGSTDATPALLEQFAQADDRVRIVRQVNMGENGARRSALRNARGEFVTFVDSDDWIDADCLLRAIAKAQQTSAEVVLFAVEHFGGDTVLRRQLLDGLDWPMDGTRALAHTIGGWRIHGLGIFRRVLYNRAFVEFENYDLPRGVGVAELATRIALFLAPTIDHVDCLYHYRAHPSSLTSSFSTEWLGYLANLEATGKFLSKAGELERLMVSYLTDSLNQSNYLFSVWNDPKTEMTDHQRREGIQRILAFWSRLPKRGLLRYAREKRLPLREQIRLLLIAAGLYPLVYSIMSHIRSTRFA